MKASSASKNNRVWQERIATELEPVARALNDSLAFDQRLWPEEIGLSAAYAHSLHEAHILDGDELQSILTACAHLELAIRQERVTLEGEDVHEAIETQLVSRAGSAGGKIHTGRSRNEQVSTLLRMRIMQLSEDAIEGVRRLERAILSQAKRAGDQMVASYTHLQPAQPILLAHWWLAHASALERDELRFGAARESADQLPMGAAAVAGSPLVYDRLILASRLGFSRVASNSIDAVGDRDFALSYLQAAAQLGLHLSRLAEDLVLACSPGFGWFIAPDGYSTGSSLLPQKRNPDLFELLRGKSGRLIANSERLAIVLKGLPSSYQKDLQEDKEAVFDTAETLETILAVLPDAIAALKPIPEKMDRTLTPELTAVDLVDTLIQSGESFRDAHAVVGRLFAKAEGAGVSPAELPLDARIAISPWFGDDLIHSIGHRESISRRDHSPGTGPASVERQIEQLETRLGIEGKPESKNGEGANGSGRRTLQLDAQEPLTVRSQVGSDHPSLAPKDSVLIRRATLEDVQGIAAIMASHVAQGVLLPRPLGELYQSIREFYVAAHGKQVVACAALRLLWSDMGEVRSLAVHGDYRGKGLGLDLVKKILADAAEIELPRVIALTREPAFFERCGFQPAVREELPRKIWADCVRCPRRYACDEVAVEFVLDPSHKAEASSPSWELSIPKTVAKEAKNHLIER